MRDAYALWPVCGPGQAAGQRSDQESIRAMVFTWWFWVERATGIEPA